MNALSRVVLVFFILTLISVDAECAKGQAFPDELRKSLLLQPFTDKQKEQLLKGDVVFTYVQTEDSEKSMAGNGVAYVLIHHSAKDCYDLFTIFDTQYLYMPHVVKSDVLKTEADKITIFKKLDFLLVNIRYTHILTKQPDELRVDFVTDPTGENTIKFNKGYFQFQEVSTDCALFTFFLEKVDTGFRIPNFLKKFLIARDLPGVAENVKKRMESGGTWQK
ncbi:MAG: hypothetical protein KKD44_04725 [Proteobacteria bacterium]|nr:hypothetical protein [Pseudomonadota bacterium]